MAIIKKYWKSELIILGVVLIFSLLMLPGSTDANLEFKHELKSYGGKLSTSSQLVLHRLHEDLRNIREILAVNTDRIRLIDMNDEIREYSFAYNALWNDRDVALNNVNAFHFEFRDQWGNLLTRAGLDPSSIETIGYTIRLTSGKKEVTTSNRIVL